MPAPTRNDHTRLFQLWARLETFPPVQAAEGVHHFAQQLGEWIGAPAQVVVLTRRHRPDRTRAKDHPGLAPWRQVHLDHLGVGAQERRTLAAALAQQPQRYAKDPVFKEVTQRAGTLRVVCPSKVVGRQAFERSPGFEIMRAFDLGHRLIASRPIDENLELNFLFDRYRRDRPFGADESCLLEWALNGLGHLGRWYAMELGHLRSRRHLTPRERQTLRLLLAGLSEKELASELGLQTRSAHEHVLSLYRKFRVNSRPALMSLWTHGAAPLPGGAIQTPSV